MANTKRLDERSRWGSATGTPVRWAAAFALAMGLALPGLPACGGAQQQTAESPTQKQNEEKAQRLLARAKQAHDADRFRRIISRFGDTKAAGEARDELAAILIEQSKQAIKQDDWATAEDRTDEARMYAGLDLTQKAIELQNQIDDHHAAFVAGQAAKDAAQGKCASALKRVAVPLRKKPRARFKKELQKQAKKPLVDCLSKKLAVEVEAGNLEPARMMLETPDATTALSESGYKEAHAVLQKLVVKRSTSGVQPLLAEHKWKEAIAKLQQMKTANSLNDKEYEVAFGIVQDAIHAHLLDLAKKALADKKPSQVADEIAAQIAIAKWKQIPDDLTAALAPLAVAVQCEKLHCRMQQPAPAWAWGAIVVHSPAKPDGATRAKIKHAQKIWVLAKARKHALVALKDPGKVAETQLFAVATGWVDPSHLKNVDTDMWLPPDNQLAGVRVWGPLRPPSKDYHLGVVKKVDGKKAVVTRIADSLDATVPLRSLRIGKLSKGLKVMAFCQDELHPETAKVEGVVTESGGVPKVKVKCDKGDLTRVEVGGALTSKAAWLPPRKP